MTGVESSPPATTATTGGAAVEPPTDGEQPRKDPRKSTGMSRGAWQLKLLPLMTAMLVLVTLAFLILSFVEANVVRSEIRASPRLELAPALAQLNCNATTTTVSEHQDCARWQLLALLEAHTIQQRYHQANVALILRGSIKYLGFLTGMILSVIGAVFILGRLTEAASHLAAEGSFGKLSIETVSPGLILAVLGTVLMLVTVFVNPPTEVSDAAVYLVRP